MDSKKALLYVFILLTGFAITYFTIRGHFSFETAGFLIFLLIFIPTLANPNIGLAIIIISMIYSPEAVAGQTAARLITIRTEDVLLLVIILAWFIRTSFTKDIATPFRTRLTGPFFLYLTSCVLSTFFAIIFSEIDIEQSFFSILKYLEYFLLFIMVKDNLKDMKQAKVFIAIFLLTAVFTAFHANAAIQSQLHRGSTYFRVAPPIETRGGEAGTLGAYFAFIMAIIAGLLIYTRSLPLRIFLICLEVAIFRGFLYTLSRGSYMAFIPMALALIFFKKKGKFVLVYVFGVMAVLIALFLPQMVKERILTTVTAKTGMYGTQIEWESSPQERIESWKLVLFERFPNSPLFGYGVAKYFIDGQIFLTLCEVGLIGLSLLIWVLARLFKMVKDTINIEAVQNDDFSIGLSLGFLAGFVGLFFIAIGTNVFIVIRVMEPFWFVAAIVLSLPELLEKKVQEAVNHT